MNNIEYKDGIAASLINGDRLLDDARAMLDFERAPTAFALAILAQEEYSKALILSLVDVGAIPWSPNVRGVLREHVCKQLVSLILDYLCPETEEFLRRIDASLVGESSPILPPDVLDAIHVICHERIPRERERWWIDASDRPIDPKVKDVANGAIDRRKQDALYVGVGKNGQVTSQPLSISMKEATVEVARSERIGQQMRPHDLAPGLPQGLDSEKLIAFFRLLTGSLSPDEFNSLWWVRK